MLYEYLVVVEMKMERYQEELILGIKLRRGKFRGHGGSVGGLCDREIYVLLILIYQTIIMTFYAFNSMALD
jgi:hypothetical protein